MHLSEGKAPSHDDFLKLQKVCEEQAMEIEKLKFKQSMFDSLLSVLPDHIYFKDTKSRFIALSQAMKHWFGAKSIDDVIGKTDFDLFTQEHAQEAFSDEIQIIKTGVPILSKKEKETWSDGRTTWVSTSKAPLRDENGKVIGTLGISRDITQEKISQEKLKEATRTIWDERNLLQTVIDLIPDAIYVKDQNHKFVLSNRSHYTMLNYDDESEVIGKAESELCDKEAIQETDLEEASILKNNHSLINIEEVRKHPITHKEIYLSTSKVALKNYKLNGVVCVSRDITDIRQALNNLQSAKNDAEIANQAKSEFLAKMSHEIRTPLNGIVGLTQCMIDSNTNHSHQGSLNTIKQSADLLLQIIDDLLDFSKIETGAIALEKQAFNIRTLLEDVMDIVFFNFTNQNTELICLIDPSIPSKINGDTGRLRQILINLLSNARKFTHSGYILLKVIGDKQENGDMRIRFITEDTGIGIDKDHLDKIFMSFSQADNSITRKYGGTGLGLAISQKLAQLMGGEIKVLSPRKNFVFDGDQSPGSLFYFFANFTYAETDQKEIVSSRLEDKNIMILACSELTTESVSVPLNNAGAKIIIASNCTQAISHITQKSIDAIIMDKAFAEKGLSQSLQTYLSNNRKPTVLLSQQYSNDLNNTHPFPFPYIISQKPIHQNHLLDSILELTSLKTSQNVADTLQTTDSPFEKLKRIAHNKKILLVEDNPVNQQVAVAILERVGMQTDVAENGEIALKALSTKKYDLILMDLQMPIMDGVTTTQAIRKNSEFTQLPIIALTAQALKGDLEKCLQSGMNDYISKPIKAQHFYKVLHQWLTHDWPT